MANLFKGYSQKTELQGNLLKGEDRSDKILEEGKRYLSQWQGVSQGEQENQQRYLAALEAKFQAEEADRARNQKLESYFADGWAKALQKRNNQLVRNAQDKAAAGRRQQEKLVEFSQTIGKLGVQAAGKYAEQQQEFGRNLAIDLGLSWESAKSITTADGVLDEGYQGSNAAVLEARKKGASWEQIRQLHNLNFLGKQGYRVGYAQSIGENYRSNIINNFTTKYATSKGEFSLADVTSSKNPELLEVVQNKMRTEYLSKHKDIHPNLLAKYSRDAIIRAEGRVKTTVAEGRAKDEQREIDLQRRNLYLTKTKDKTLFDFVSKELETHKDNRSGVWAEFYNNIGGLAAEGRLNSAYITELLDDPRYKERFGKTLREKYPARATDLEKAANKFSEDQIAKDQLLFKQRNNALKKDTFQLKQQLDQGPKLPSGQLATMIAEANRLYGPENVMSSMLIAQSKDHVSEANDTIFGPQLEYLESKGMLTSSIVKSYNLTPATESDWLAKAKKQDTTQPTENEIKILEDHVDGKIQEILKSYGFDAKDVSSADLAAYSGKGNIKKYFSLYAQDEKLTRGQVLTQALERFEDDIKKDYKITTTGRGDTFQPHFGTFSVGAKRHPVPLSEITAEDFAVNPRLHHEKLLFDPVTIVKWFDDVDQGRSVSFPPDVSNVVSKIGVGPNGEIKETELTVLMAAIKQIKPDYELPPQLLQAHKIGFQQIDPRYRKYIVGAHQNTNAIAAAIKYSGYTHEVNKRSETDLKHAANNTIPWFTKERNPANYHNYLNIDPNSPDWSDLLINSYE